MNPSSETTDLLTLIGRTIEQLRLCIEYFEEEDKGTGLSCLSTVITDIDAYLERLADDPLVLLAHVDPARLQESLHHVQNDLSVVIDQIQRDDTA